MIYPDNFEQKIGFDSIRTLIAEACVSNMGREFVSKIRFSSNPSVIDKMLLQTTEFIQILETGGAFPTHDYIDLRPELARLGTPGTYLAQEDLFDLKSSLVTLQKILVFFNKTGAEEYPQLKSLIANMAIPDALLEKAGRIMDDKGQIRDTASDKLAIIRRQLIVRQRQVMQEVRKAFSQARKAGWLPENAEITIRNGRAVIPVKAADKRALRGIIHDESSTGQTVFIEPVSSFEVSNEILELESEERREIVRVLVRFTDELRPLLEPLAEAYRILGLLDFIRAKALFSKNIGAVRPVISKNHFHLKKGVHPLLYLSHKASGKMVVPLEMELERENRLLLISGPNAGGKSVCLMTVGLLQYMLQCGLPVSASPDSEFRIFDRIFIDIGDEQSLENDLSTYSSHLLNMKFFLQHANSKSLILIDEFGTGTEPQLGAAIAEAALEQLVHKQTFGVITTHYTSLKLATERLDGTINGAMLFDVKELRPLYRLKIGKPGSSFAFEIARKIGFPQDVLNRAKKKSGGKHLRFDTQLQQLEADKLTMAQKQKEISVSDEQLSQLIEKYKHLSEQLETEKKQIIRQAKMEALEIVRQSNRTIENTIREIREAQADKEKTKQLRQQLDETKKELEKSIERRPLLKKKTTPKKHPKKEITHPKHVEISLSEPLHPGDFVEVKESGIVGELLAIEGKDSFVNVNNIRLKISTDKLLKTNKKPKTNTIKRSYSGIMQEINQKAEQFELTLNLRGKRADEAMELLIRYIDDALLLSIKEVSILHGKGYGILREIIRGYLQSVKEIEHFGDAPVELGGAGITKIRFR
ncbi:Recombination inhibitory protein MutS2 [hydrothermal vent metagenome]|uniref:Recombination inhibitory protein MutS2 n=1 Tax=hydrothermal vent metagenome TaxID=652676 RepID=A0A3B0V093_9ZZZZ